jgi:hypothetical protein
MNELRRCKFIIRTREIVLENGRQRSVTNEEEKDGYFHAWGCNREETGESVGNYTIGIVEDSDGKIYEAYPADIKFEAPQKYTVETKVETVDLQGKHRLTIRNWDL